VSTATALDEAILHDVDMADSVKSHMIYTPFDKQSSEAWIAEARTERLEVEALCGHKFIPDRDPLAHPICEPCIEVAGIIVANTPGGTK